MLLGCVLGCRLAPKSRPTLLTVGGLALVVAAAPAWPSLFPVPCMALVGWLALRAQAHWAGLAALWGGVAAVVGTFLLARHAGPALGLLPPIGAFGSVGLSYVMFRLLHLLVDAHGGDVRQRIPATTFLSYLLFPPAFLAGPIHRFREFDEDLASTEPAANGTARPHFRRILGGLFAALVLAGIAHEVFLRAAAAPDSAPSILLAILAYALWLYCGFAGYSEAARGAAGLMGVRLPANFDAPWRAENMLAIWTRWHLSLSEWFRLYLFNPILRLLLAAQPRPRLVPWLGAVAYLLTFAVMGLWHGLGWRLLLYGLVLGLLTGGNRVWQASAMRRLGKARHAALTRNPVYAAAARTLGIGAFLLALCFLWAPFEALARAPTAWFAAGAATFAFCALATLLPRLPAPLAAGKRTAAILEVAALIAWIAVMGRAGVPPLIYEFF